MQRTVLIAIGGNSLLRAGEPTTVATERTHVAETCRAVAGLVADFWRVVVTHGNGPQVGAALRRSETAAAEAYPLPLDMCVASTQGEIGILIQQALGEELEARRRSRPIATVLSQVVVAPDDPAFARPSKPIGPFYSQAVAEARRRAGWTLVEEPPHGYRRVVPSPEPRAVVEEPVIRALLDAGVVVVALGGGGVPVVRRGGGLEGIEAVVDKDMASALLAVRLHVDLFVMLTDVDRIYVNFARPDALGLGNVTTDELRQLAADGQFPAGSMGPKVEAALRFVAGGGREAIVTSPDRLIAAIDGRAGTHIVGHVHAETRRREAACASTAAGRGLP
jgi:carbamate kinase